MATYITLINSVLAKLRESSVATPGETTYSALIGELVNESKQAVEDAWKWSALRSTKTVTTANGTSQYVVTGSGDRFKLQNTKQSVYNTTANNLGWLYQRPSAYMKEQAIVNTTVAPPSYFYFEGLDSNGDTYVNFHATPDAVYTINFDLVVPQADFSVGTETLSVPSRAVILGAYVRALAERGEDQGNTHGEAVAHYNTALQDDIAIDESKILGETTWYV